LTVLRLLEIYGSGLIVAALISDSVHRGRMPDVLFFGKAAGFESKSGECPGSGWRCRGRQKSPLVELPHPSGVDDVEIDARLQRVSSSNEGYRAAG
jgi:hypothetical protein